MRAKDSSGHNSLYSTLSSYHLHTRQLISLTKMMYWVKTMIHMVNQNLFKTTSLYHANYLLKIEDR